MDRTATELEAQIDAAMLRDRHRLRQRLRQWQKVRRARQPHEELLGQLQRDIQRSVEIRRHRELHRPRLQYDASLPVTQHHDELADAIFENPVVIVCGETGSGKSTQLPKICLELGRGVEAWIGHTQPRRIAARSVAARIAQELGTPLGSAVGFKIRFQESVRPESYIKLMTDGILLAETQTDRRLEQYDTLIIDEAHERSLNIDFLLGFLRDLLPYRPDLKLIITSATIDAERFSQHFRRDGYGAPIVEVSGRTWPVEIRYHEPMSAAGRDGESDIPRQVVDALEEFRHLPKGDLLVFLPTEYLILETARAVRGIEFPGDGRPAEVLPLYARLSGKEQQRIFEPHEGRRIVLATNVAESSLTVPGIRYVIDTGTARISRYSSRSRLQRLPIERVSRASADQRAGRCGRIGPGVCVRLYSQDDYFSREQYTVPEIRRTNLASVILRTTSLRLGSVEHFPFLDPPHADMVRDGYETLFEIGALTAQHELTPLGQRLAQLPVDPRVARMIVAGADERCLPEILIIASALEVQDPRERPVDRQAQADEAHRGFLDANSDFLGYLKLWHFYRELRESHGERQTRRRCQEAFLSFQRLREWSDIHRQLCELVEESSQRRGRRLGATRPSACVSQPIDLSAEQSENHSHPRDPARYAAIHRAILSGLLSGVALKSDEFEYTGAQGIKLAIWPGSGVFQQRPKWIVAAELVETSRRYARTVARIDPAWIEPLARHLIEKNHRDPFWSRADGAGLLLERVTLFGLPIVKRRRVRCAPIDPRTARELLIWNGLVEGDLDMRAAFLRRNQELIADLNRRAAKSRTRSGLVSQQACADFYQARLPVHVVDAAALHYWQRKTEQHDPRQLLMTAADLLEHPQSLHDADAAEFPDEFPIDDLTLPLEYRFEPGSEDDGVTIVVPVRALAKLRNDQLDWLVPGMLPEKVEALLRLLPKSQRRELPPAQEAARRIMPLLEYRSGSFLPALAAATSRIGNAPVDPQEFPLDRIPYHLRMKIRVVNDQGMTLARGTDADALRQLLGITARVNHEVDEPGWRRIGISTWDFGELPPRLEIRRGGIRMPAFPCLVDQGPDVMLTLLDDAELADYLTRRAIRRLLALKESASLEPLVEWLPLWPHWTRQLATIAPADGLRSHLIERLIDQAYLNEQTMPRRAEEFQKCLEQGRDASDLTIHEIARVLTPLMREYEQICESLQTPRVQALPPVVDDLCEQLDHLIFDGFLVDVPWRWWAHYPRYLRGIRQRMERLRDGSVERDRRAHERFQIWWNRYKERDAADQAQGRFEPALETFRWLLEEYRVSLFAQSLGTESPISEKKLQYHWRLLTGTEAPNRRGT